MSGLSFCTLGIFSFALAASTARSIRSSANDITGSALLVLLGFLYERYGTYEIASLRRTCSPDAPLATLFVITSLSLIGLPLLNGFVGEFLILSEQLRHVISVGSARHDRRDPQRRLHALDDAAHLLRPGVVAGPSPCLHAILLRASISRSWPMAISC